MGLKSIPQKSSAISLLPPQNTDLILYTLKYSDIIGLFKTECKMQPYPEFQKYKEDRFSDCLFLDLKVAEGESQSSKEVSLHLTLNFNEQWEEVPLGKVKFGLRGGDLRLFLTNGRAPYKLRSMASKLDLTFVKEVTLLNNIEVSSGGDASFSSEGVTAQVSTSGKRLLGKTETSEIKTCQVSSKGSLEEPAWTFRLKSLDNETLIGLIDRHLCYMEILGFPSKLEAIFQVSRRDVWITDTEGIWPQNISSNKRAILERELLFYLIGSRFQPYLSRVTLNSD
ncbi:MAG: hypothetical protein AAFY20_13255 [Cyanobacteria bacterium J06639_14]